MALAKEISINDTGVTATYWRATGLNVDMIAGVAKITVSGYISQQARNEGKRPIAQRMLVWSGADNPITPQSMLDGTVFTKVYQKLTQENVSPFVPNNPFVGASSV